MEIKRKFQQFEISGFYFFGLTIYVNKYDPVTPPKNGLLYKETLSNGKLFILDMEGHGVTSDCATQVMIDFMNNPRGAIDTSCLPIAR